MSLLASFVSSWPEWTPELLRGLWTSLQLTGALVAIGLPLGLLMAIGVGSRARPLRLLSLGAVEFSRGVPVLVFVYLVYFGLPEANLNIGAFAAGSLALGITLAGYTSEVFRAGIQAVPRGQREAARAIGLTGGQELRLVVLPQAIRIVIPPLLGYVVVYFQATSLCFAIAVPELLSRAYTIGSTTFQYLGALLLAAVMYAAISIPASQSIEFFDRRRELRS